MNMKIVFLLLQKEFLLEFRQQYAISGIVLYVFSMIFVVYLGSIRVQPPIWNILFWLIVLFASINAVVKSFVQESGHRQLYYYQIAPAYAVIVAKTIYNVLLLWILNLIAFAAYSIVAGCPVKDTYLFMIVLLLGSLGFSIALTLISSIAGQARNSATLLAILGFPVLLPILLTLMKLSNISLRVIQDTGYERDLINLLAIDVILGTLSVVLFPFIWKD